MKSQHYLGVAALAIAAGVSSWSGASAQTLQPRAETLSPVQQGEPTTREHSREHGGATRGEGRRAEQPGRPGTPRQMSEEEQQNPQGSHMQRAQQEQKGQPTHQQMQGAAGAQGGANSSATTQRAETPQGSRSNPSRAETNQQQQPAQRTAQPATQQQQTAPTRSGTANANDNGQAGTNAPTQAQGNPPGGTQQRNAAQPQDSNSQNAANNQTNVDVRGSINLEPRVAGNIRERLFQTRDRNTTRFDVAIGTVVPGAARLRPVPTEYIETAPALRGYEYTVVDEDVVIVEPRTKRVVEVLGPAGRGGYAASAPVSGQAIATGAAVGAMQQQPQTASTMPASGSGNNDGLTMSTGQREALRRDLLNQSQQAKLDISTGAQLPQTIEVAPIPQQSVANVPALQGLSYFVSNDRVVIVEPQRHIIVDVIQ